jgi:hypothetical protein
MALTLVASGCCKKPGDAKADEDEDGAKPGAVTTALPHHEPVKTHKPAPRQAKVSTAGEATVNAPAFRSGAPRRGIVRSAPNFQASEVARLDNGTVLNLIRPPLPGGWCEVSWPISSDANRGFIHSDVLDITLYGD